MMLCFVRLKIQLSTEGVSKLGPDTVSLLTQEVILFKMLLHIVVWSTQSQVTSQRRRQ